MSCNTEKVWSESKIALEMWCFTIETVVGRRAGRRVWTSGRAMFGPGSQ